MWICMNIHIFWTNQSTIRFRTSKWGKRGQSSAKILLFLWVLHPYNFGFNHVNWVPPSETVLPFLPDNEISHIFITSFTVTGPLTIRRHIAQSSETISQFNLYIWPTNETYASDISFHPKAQTNQTLLPCYKGLLKIVSFLFIHFKVKIIS